MASKQVGLLQYSVCLNSTQSTNHFGAVLVSIVVCGYSTKLLRYKNNSVKSAWSSRKKKDLLSRNQFRYDDGTLVPVL